MREDHREGDGDDIEVSVAAPKGSQAEHLVLFTDKDTLWIRFSPPFMCYPVESVQELSDIIDAIVRDDVCFMVAMRGSEEELRSYLSDRQK